MDEGKLAQLIFQQRPVPAQAFDDRITRQLNRLVREEEQVMKRKISILAICVIAILVLSIGGALAQMLGFNLFEIFGQKDERLKELAPKAYINEISPITENSPELGTTVAGINSAYYDGQSLLVTYSIQNGNRLERFIPNDETLAKMTLVDSQLGMMAGNEEEAVIMKEWIVAKESGTAMGIERYSVSPSDHTVTDDGIDLPSSTENQMEGKENTVHYIREYENPLPEEARDREYLNIQIRLSQGVSYLYFDGRNTYAYSENVELDPMQATAWRIDAEVRRFSGEGEYNGYPVSVEASVSAATARVTATMDSGIFPALPEDTWYDIILLDESGTEYRAREGSDGNVKQMSVSFDGTGKLPESLTLRIMLVTEGEWDREAAMANATPFVLNLVVND